MEEILRNTHRKYNIDLLKARDYYFEKSRWWHRIANCLTLIPPILLAISYIPYLPNYAFIDEQRDLFIGIIAIISFLLIHFICNRQISKNLVISNALREEYDCVVLGIPRNPFAYSNCDLSRYLDKSAQRKDFFRYEVWYAEIFGKDNPRNALCAQLNNILYTYHAYSDYKRHIVITLCILFAISLFASLFGMTVFFLVMISMFNAIQYYIVGLSTTKDLIARNKELVETIRHEQQRIQEAIDCDQMDIIRMLQDIVMTNRDEGLFLPLYIRDRHLREDSIYYRDLNEFKAIYLANTEVSIPSSALELEVFTLDEQNTHSLQDIHSRLLSMMHDIAAAFDKHGVQYSLEGGSLIGAMREHSFIFWDDDIDLSMPIDMLERAKTAIRTELSDKYDIQDYNTDTYYSPRLSNFRIRDKKSFITEKDSQFYRLYKNRGLFIDIYVYTPILYAKWIDRIYRYLLIHPLNKRMARMEAIYTSIESGNKPKYQLYLRAFRRLKRKYIHRVNWYLSHAHNDTYYVYTPNYIHNRKKAGPYIPKEYLYGKKKTTSFEDMKLPIPSCPERVLEAYYGAWQVSPFQTMEEMIQLHGESQWFSKNTFPVSVMKHIDHVNME